MVSNPAKPRSLTPEQKNDLIAPVVGGLKELVFGRPGLFIDRPGFIAGTEPLDPLPAAVRGLTQLNCRIWARADKSGYSPGVNAQNADLCGPYLDGLGEKPGDGGVGPSFEGGQCPILYNVTGAVVVLDGGCNPLSVPVGLIGIPGPISNVGYDNTGSVGGAPPTCDGALGTLAFIRDGNGNKIALGGSGGGVSSASVSVVPTSGGLDSCGDPESEYEAPGTITGGTPPSPTININLPGLGPVEVTVTIDPDGNPRFTFPEIGVDFTVDVGGEDEPGGDGGNSPPPGDVGNPGSPESTGEGGEVEGEAPPGTVLTGLKLNLTQLPPAPSEYAPGVYRGVCYIYMGTDEGLDHDPAGAMVRDGQFVFAERENLTKWKVSANVGFEISVVPYYREVE